LFNALSVADFLRDVTTLGMLWRDDATKVAAFGEPMGVVAALIPVTNPTSTIIFKVLSAVKAGNAIVCAPHPRGIKCGMATVKVMADVAEQMGAPKGLIQCLDQVTIAGNVPCYVHKSKAGEIGEVAEMIVTSKCFDYGTACVSEQAVIADPEIARELRQEMKMRGAYFCTLAESDRLSKVIFTGKQAMNAERVGQSPQALADAAGFSIPPKTRCLVSEETEIGWHRPLSAEKLNPVLAFYEARDSQHGIEMSISIAKFEGWGHSACLHSNDPEIVAQFAAVPTGRVLVNTPAILGGMGYSTDLEPSFMLGTGTWSGSITSDNVTALHLINIKRVAYENRPWRDIYEEYGE
jgi:acyl-CoA reductase-like NAD-dependent aldehyde dehydrogenase